MPYEVYRIIHFTGIFLVLLGFGSLVVHALLGAGKEAPGRKLGVIGHGVGLVLILIAGFGLLARLGIHWPWPGWVWAKVAIWLAMGAIIAVIRRKPQSAQAVWFAVFVLAVLGAVFAGLKPF